MPLAARPKRLLKKSEAPLLRGLKSARRVKNKGLIGTTEVGPCYKARAGLH